LNEELFHWYGNKKKETYKIKDKSSDDDYQLNFLIFLLVKIQNVALMNLSWYEILFILSYCGPETVCLKRSLENQIDNWLSWSS
jgi:hypothetical protein